MKKNESIRYETRVYFYSDNSRTYVDGVPMKFTSRNKEQLKEDFEQLNILNDLSVHNYIITDLVNKQYTNDIKNLLL